MVEVRGRVRDESWVLVLAWQVDWVYVRACNYISALLLVESRRDASDGLEASAGYHLAVYMSGSPSPSPGPASPRPNRERGRAKRLRAPCLLLASRGFALCCIQQTTREQHGHLMGTLVGK